LLAEYENSTTYFIHKDHLGSTRVMTKVDGSVYDSMDYLPFGEQIAGSAGSTHKFTGKERDAETGLDNFEARYMSSSLGRFMSADDSKYINPADPQTFNLYSYVANNPLNAVDPTGHEPDASLAWAEHRYKRMQHGGSLDDSAGNVYGDGADSGPSDSNSGTGDGNSTATGSDAKTYLYEVSDTVNGVIQPAEIVAVQAMNGNDAEAAVMADAPEPPAPSCSATLRFRAVNLDTDKAHPTHSFWQVHDSDGKDWTISGGPSNSDGSGFLQVWVVPGLKNGDDNDSATIHSASGSSPANCAGVKNLLDSANAWHDHGNSRIIYNPVFGPNSNSVAHYFGDVGGFSPAVGPPGAVGWDKKIRPY
jgi:RHS repeat-associated protein